jgi:hypothetical protein
MPAPTGEFPFTISPECGLNIAVWVAGLVTNGTITDLKEPPVWITR